MSEVLFYAKFQVPYHGIKKNNKQIARNRATGQAFIRSSDKALFAKKWLNQKLIAERLKQRIDMITTDVVAEFIFHFPETLFFTKKGLRSKTLSDLSNLYEMAQDCLQDAGIIENDTNIVNHGNSHRRPIVGSEYWLEIKLSKPKESYFSKLFETASV
jgi:Holliday junction resolvase RusA-like endonuclease